MRTPGLCHFKHKTPHGDIHDKSQHDEVDDCGRAAITDKRKRNAYNRHEANHHTDIDEYLPEEIKENPSAENTAKMVFGVAHRIYYAQ